MSDVVKAGKKNKELLPNQAEIIKKYGKHLRASGKADLTIANKINKMNQFALKINKPFDNITREDLEIYLDKIYSEISERTGKKLKSSTLCVMKSEIKQFFRWLKNTEDYPPIVKWIKTGFATSNSSLKPEDVLTPEETKSLIETASTSMHRALISIMWDTGGRCSEIVSMDINSITQRDKYAEIHIKGTKNKYADRTVPIVHSLPYLNQWLDIHPFRNNKNAPLWLSNTNRRKHQRLTNIGIAHIIKEVTEKADIKKNIHPHSFRHGRATDLSKKGLSEYQLCTFFGWKIGSNIPQTYIKMVGRDLTPQFLSIEGNGEYKTQPIENPIQPINCPICDFTNGATARFCSRCGRPLDETEILAPKTLDPLQMLSLLKQSFDTYSKLVDNACRVFDLRRLLNQHNTVTKSDFIVKVGDEFYSKWLGEGIIQNNAGMISLTKDGRTIIDRYCEFWKNFRGET